LTTTAVGETATLATAGTATADERAE